MPHRFLALAFFPTRLRIGRQERQIIYLHILLSDSHREMKLLTLFNSAWRMLCDQGNVPPCFIEARNFLRVRRIDIFTSNPLVSEVDLVCPLVLCQTFCLRSGKITVTSFHSLGPCVRDTYSGFSGSITAWG
jgi:hypothetical protein